MRFGRAFSVAFSGTILCAGIVSAVYAQKSPSDDEIIVEGEHIPDTLSGGEWQFDLSRAYHFGTVVTDQNEARPMGKEQSWRFCIADAKVEALTRQLVGQGRSESAGTTVCQPMRIRLRNGKLDAQQQCTGGSIIVPHEVSGAPVSRAARNNLTVSARYSPDTIVIDFMDLREPLVPVIPFVTSAPPPPPRRDGRRWSIKAKRLGDCAT